MAKEKKKVPALRFKAFTNDWEQHKLGDLGSVQMNKRIFKDQTSESGEVPFFKIGTFGKKPDSFITKKLFDEYKSKYPYPEVGDILISASGSIGRTVVYKGEDAYFQDSNIVWLEHDSRLKNSFLEQFLKRTKWNKIEGSTIKRLYNKDILNKKINLPDQQEQSTIGNFFKQLDFLITLHQRKLVLLKQLKKGLLQKMFADKGSKRPILRFEGFNDDWEGRKLENSADYIRGSFPQPYGNKEWYGGTNAKPFVQVVDVNTNMRLNKKTKEQISVLAQPKSRFVPSDSIVVTLQGSIGRVAITQYDSYVDRTLLIFTKYKVPVDKYFWAYSIQNIFRIEKQKAPGGTIKTITKRALSSFEVSLPVQEEQKKIGTLLKNIDDIITSQQEEVSKLKKIKKSLLQQMFI